MNLVADSSPLNAARLARMLACANQNAALVIEALCSQSAVLADGVRHAQPNAGQVEVTEEIRGLVAGSELAVLAPGNVPRFVSDRSAPYGVGAERFLDRTASRYPGGHQFPPDRYSVHCTPQIHGALLDQLRRARRPVEPAPVECVAGSDITHREHLREVSPAAGAWRTTKAGVVASLKAAIAALASISERRLSKLLDPAQSHGLPASLVPNPDRSHYGLMVLRYRAAVLVSELSERATPAVSTAAPSQSGPDNDASLESGDWSHDESLSAALQSVLALERFAAVQALRVRMALLARVHGAGLAPTPGEFAVRLIAQFEGAGLTTVWDTRKLGDEIETVRGMLRV